MKDGWEVKKLQDITSKIGSGATPRGGQSAYKMIGTSLIRSMNVHDLKFKEKNLAFIDDEQAKALENASVLFGDVLINITGASIARCCVVPVSKLPAHVNQHVSILRPIPEYLSSEFLSYLLVSKEQKDRLLDIGNDAGATRQALTKAQLQSFKIPLPPLEEQKRIVYVLDTAFEGLTRARENVEANLESARELFESFSGSVFSRCGVDWKSCTIGDVITLQRGIDITKKEQRDGPIPVVSSGGIKSFHDTAHTSGPGVVVGRKGSIGSVHYVVEDYWPHDTTLWVRDFKGNEPELVYFLLKGMRLADLDTGAANPSLNRNLVHPIKISWPNNDLQKTIVKELSSASMETEMIKADYRTKLQDLDDLRQSLLQKAFAGELT